MSSFTVPIAYRRWVEQEMARLMAEVARDAEYRNDNDSVIRSLASIPDQYVDQTRIGRFMIVVGPPQSTLGDLPPYNLHDDGEGAEA
jgi:hypothetical protein